MTQDLIERIYACSFVPEQWSEVLGELASMAGARAGMLFVISGDSRCGAASTDAGRAAIADLHKSGYIERIPRVAKLSALRHAGFVRDCDMFTLEEMKRDPFYREILYPRGLGWAAGTNFDLSSCDRYMFSVEREFARGPVEAEAVQRLDELRPHLGRAALVAARLQLERAQSAADTLALIGLPAIILDHSGKAIAANALADEFSEPFLTWRAFGRVALGDKRADRLLHEGLQAIAATTLTAPQSFPVRESEGGAPMVLHLLPIRAAACDLFARCFAALIFMPVVRQNAPTIELIQALFDFTPAEARVAQKLAIGKSVDEMAADAGLSPNTVRTHMRNVLAKTGCARQAEAAAILGSASPPFFSPRD